MLTVKAGTLSLHSLQVAGSLSHNPMFLCITMQEMDRRCHIATPMVTMATNCSENSLGGN